MGELAKKAFITNLLMVHPAGWTYCAIKGAISTSESLGSNLGSAWAYSQHGDTAKAEYHLTLGGMDAASLAAQVAPMATGGAKLASEGLEAVVYNPLTCPCFTENTLVLAAAGAVPISQVKLGQRVLPDLEECKTSIGDDLVDVQLDATALSPEGGTITLLRPSGWLASVGAVPGRLVFVDLPEVGARGWASVRSVRAAGPVQDGPGCVVTALFHHEAQDLIRLVLSSGEEIEVTAQHLVFSEARGWTPAGALRLGEELRTQTGTATVISLVPTHEGRQEVFNLEVSGGHQYYVGKSAILAHNQCFCRNLDAPILFGQRRIAPHFATINSHAPESIKGRLLTDVAEDLRNGVISPDELLVQYVVTEDGKKIAVNNRALAVFRMAGKEPTNTRQVPLTSEYRERLKERPIDRSYTTPGRRIPVTINKDGTGHLYTVFF